MTPGPALCARRSPSAPAGETIELPAGTYTLTSGELEVSKALTIDGDQAANTVLRQAGEHRLIFAEGRFPLTISDLTLRDGHDRYATAVGGAIRSLEVDLTILRSAVVDNSADASGLPDPEAGGGGIAEFAGSLTVRDSRIADNVAEANGAAGEGGGQAEGGGVIAVGRTAISGSTLSGNLVEARGGEGVPVPEQDGGEAYGGGLITVQNEVVVSPTTETTISGNRVDVSAGPGGQAGYAVGGGAYVEVDAGSIEWVNTTLAGNLIRSLGPDGKAFGGGAYLVGARLLDTTIASNGVNAPEADEVDGGNAFLSQVAIGGSIVSGGSGAPGSDNCYSEKTESLGFNLEGSDQCGFHGNGDRVGVDPQLEPLVDNGGPVPTMAPAASSPAVDQGSRFNLATDVRGVIRPVDFPSIPNSSATGADGSDIGAVELQPATGLALGKLTRNKKKGIATLTVSVPQPAFGSLVLKGKGLKTREASVGDQGAVTFVIAATGKARRALRKNGIRKIGLQVTYDPVANAPVTVSRKATLTMKKKHHKKRKHRGKGAQP